jgi:hypothetical protein
VVRIYGNKTASLAIANFENINDVNLYPNPSRGYFSITSKASIDL